MGLGLGLGVEATTGTDGLGLVVGAATGTGDGLGLVVGAATGTGDGLGVGAATVTGDGLGLGLDATTVCAAGGGGGAGGARNQGELSTSVFQQCGEVPLVPVITPLHRQAGRGRGHGMVSAAIQQEAAHTRSHSAQAQATTQAGTTRQGLTSREGGLTGRCCRGGRQGPCRG